MNILDDRDVRVIYRKLRKKEFDEAIHLSASHDDSVRLLDEGTVVDGAGNPWFYIKKGALREFYENLSDDFVGAVTLAHFQFSEFPFIIGEWRKKDLSLVDIGDGRQGLNVKLHLDEESIFVKELRRLNYSLGVSAELHGHTDAKLTEKVGIDVMDKIAFGVFSIVGNAGNVNSSGINLKGGRMTVQELNAALEGETADLGELNKKFDVLLSEPAEEPEEEAKEAETPVAEVKADDEEESVNLAAVEAGIDAIRKENEELRAELEQIQAQLSAKLQEEKEFISKFKNLSASLNATPKQVETPIENVFTDGIGA